MKNFLYLLLFFLSFNIKAQNISTQDALEELHFFNEAITNAHPHNYAQKGKVNIKKTIDFVKEIEKDSLTGYEYMTILKNAIYDIQCGHTSLRKFPLHKRPKPFPNFPLTVRKIENNLVSIKADSISGIEFGEQILTVNEIPVSTFFQKFKKVYPSDGGTNALNDFIVNNNWNIFISDALYYPDTFQITTNKRTVAIPALIEKIKTITSPFSEKFDWQTKPVLSNENNILVLEKDLAILKIQSFDEIKKSFIKEAMKIIIEKQSPYLVIDLRGNPGGEKKKGELLLSYLVKEKVSMVILEANINIEEYLGDTKGTGFKYVRLIAGKENLFKTKKTKLGKESTHITRPKSSNYKGKIIVLTNGLTGSTSTVVSSVLKQQKEITFIGSQTGGGYNGCNLMPCRLTLPKSGSVVNFPMYHIFTDKSSKQESGIIPDYPTSLSLEDIQNNTDVDMEVVYDIVKEK